MIPLLSVKALSANYDQIQALKGIDLEVNTSEIVAMIGSNGAGKTTSFKSLAGWIPANGSAKFLGSELLGLKPEERLKLGLAICPEGRGVFGQMSVHENLLMGAYLRRGPEVKSDLELQYSRFPRLKERHRQLAGTLSGGEQQMLAIARALMSRPKLLMLDEPSLGLAPKVVLQIFELLKDLHSQGMSILLVEQNARMALKVCQRAYILETGRISRTGVGSDLLKDESVLNSYLGH